MIDLENKNSPVLLITYKRPKNTEKLINILIDNKIKNIFIYNNGSLNDLDLEDCKKTKNIVKKYSDLHNNIRTLFKEKNTGLKYNIPEALDWVFETFDRTIILEDDCFPDKSFFKFCNILLEKYNNDQRIAQISGNNFLNFRDYVRRNNDSYFFSKFTSSWGWATWKDKWQSVYDEDIRLWPIFKNEGWIKDFLKNEKSENFWTKYLERRYQLKDDDWDKPWTLANFMNNRLSIFPNKNLISNTGNDSAAAHKNPKKWNSMKLEEMKFPLKHPKFIVCDTQVDDFITSQGFSNPKLVYRIKNKIKKLFLYFFLKLLD